MDLKLIRKEYQRDGIFGILTDVGGKVVAHTLEHAYSDGTGWAPKIPDGEFVCVRGEHQLASGPIETFEITGVPGHSGLLFHYGNFNKDSEGCVLVGEAEAGNALTKSRAAFAKLMALQDGVDQFNLTVTRETT